MRVLSLGGGVQSTTILLMAVQHEYELDAAIFADTQWERSGTYRHLEWLEQIAADADIPIIRTTKGSLRRDALDAKHVKAGAWMPFHVRKLKGGKGFLKRQCTATYKIEPIEREVRQLIVEHLLPPRPKGKPWLVTRAGAVARQRGIVVEQAMGISWDEHQRMSSDTQPYIHKVYPLIDRRMTRQDCLKWLGLHGYPQPPKSACIGCPFHDQNYWLEMKREDPEAWADAVDFDQRVRGARRIDGEVYLHRELIPLSQVDLRSKAEQRGQIPMLEDTGEVCAEACFT